MSAGKPRAAKMDRRTVARLDAAVIEWSRYEQKESYKLLIEELKEAGITVTFDQIEKSVHRLGLKWRDVFLPATRLERGHPDARANDAKPKATGQGPDMRAVLDRIEQLEETLATSGMAEYRALCDRIRSLDERATVIHTDVKRAVVESRNLRQQAKQEAGLAKERAAAIQADMKKMLEWMQTLASVASKVNKMENLLLSVFLHVVPQSVPSEKEAQQ